MVENKNLNAQTHACVTVAADSGDSPSQPTPGTSTVLWGGASQTCYRSTQLEGNPGPASTFISAEGTAGGKHKESMIWDSCKCLIENYSKWAKAEGRHQERVVFVTETRKLGRTAHTLQESGLEETRVNSAVEGSEIWG